jgi:endoglucanase
MVKKLKDIFHVTVIRCFIGVEAQGGYLVNSNDAYKCLYAVADECVKEGIYCIVCWGTFVGHQPEATTFFKAVANRYHGSQYVIYEPWNEPEKAAWPEVKAYSEALIKVIRGIDSGNLIICPDPKWDQDIMSPANDPIKGDDNIAYSFHIYAGTHPLSYQDDLKNALKKGITVWATEIGAMNADGNGALAVDKFNSWIDLYEANKISWLGWAVQDKAESCSLFKSINTLELTEWGQLFKKTILKYQ